MWQQNLQKKLPNKLKSFFIYNLKCSVKIFLTPHHSNFNSKFGENHKAVVHRSQ